MIMCVCMYMYVRIDVCLDAHMYGCTYVHTYVCMYVIFMYVSIYIYICMYGWMDACVYEFTVFGLIPSGNT